MLAGQYSDFLEEQLRASLIMKLTQSAYSPIETAQAASASSYSTMKIPEQCAKSVQI